MHRGQSYTHLFLILTFILGMGLLSSCAKKAVVAPETPSVATEQIPEAPNESAVTAAGAESEQGIGESALSGQNATTETYGEEISEARTSAPMLPIYFDFDKYNIRPDMKSRIEQNAKFLLDHPSVRIEIQGNCDERGSNEYNLALGEKRAKAAKAYLVNLGVNPDRIETVSFGEEKPLDPGHNEKAWAKNRRDDFVIIR